MDIEKALKNYLNNKGPKIKVNDFCSILNKSMFTMAVTPFF